jgi:O-antigen ligase
LLGWGFDASRAITDARPEALANELPLLPLHPHSAPLQIWFELGIPGVVLTLVLLWLLARRIDVLPRPARVCGQALFITTLTIASTAYGVWQNQWLAMMFSAALLIPLTLCTPAGAAELASDRAGSNGPDTSGGRD